MPSKWTKKELDRRLREIVGDEGDDSPSARKRRRILRAGHDLFLQRGYRKTSIDDVARKAEVAKGTVYLYFENKGQLLAAAITLEKAAMYGRIVPLFDGTIPERDRLRAYLVLALTAARDLPLFTRLMTGDAELFAALEDIGAEEIATRTSEGTEFLAELIEDAVPGRLTDEEKRARADAIIALAFCSVTLLDERIRGKRSLDEIASTLADMVVHGVGGRRKGS